MAEKEYGKYVTPLPIFQIPHDGYNFEGKIS